ncbi:uncharacterized protein NFIA_024050 [Aspergillus fischeri NRRL 181]|uniref:Uncharacterized protein n=1 Tax=Neosartorya fischeri (strain ATCC 1020 / DSM 3700 / CBS 544.65 / FGSC A1164 / JCM 1740 / NRRL 181 / WB 181) TaxID=331117 RepID=A1D5H2_NEOFI|nr:uncharacterized protein NFIA_024050 [Aspergillus fischeri NRRL 181]EAW22026.1 hypothetical protein NFIA_024050 [Aspergillus fischeri NRRL 181]
MATAGTNEGTFATGSLSVGGVNFWWTINAGRYWNGNGLLHHVGTDVLATMMADAIQTMAVENNSGLSWTLHNTDPDGENSYMGKIAENRVTADGEEPIRLVHVNTGPCKEPKVFGVSIGLTRLFAPLLNKADGGDYIKTMGINVVRVNWLIARTMVLYLTKPTRWGLIMKP